MRGERPYVVYPAITYTHKNHGVLLDAFARVRGAVPDARLVLLGGTGGAEAAVAARCAAPDLAGAVLRPGRVPRAVLDALVERARVLAFPSRYEGFGLPVVEALAAGCPVVAADVDALREVLGGDGVLVGPDDVAGWTTALAGALQAPRDDTTRAGVARRTMDRYAPGRTVATLVDAYRDAAGW
jgi:alpha-1,3-rhamnosyl/mannosyltransferase